MLRNKNLDVDSYNIHFEKIDLHPPTRSSSRLDQYTHHHRKADSAYSSFSGGSTAPDYPSSALADDYYADVKYVRGVYSPGILNSNSPPYQSTEATVHQHNRKGFLGRDPSVPFTHLPPSSPTLTQPPPSPPPPTPPPPDYLDSFLAPEIFQSPVMSQPPECHTLNLSKSKSDLVYDLWVPKKFERKQALVDRTSDSRSESVFTRQSWQLERLEQTMMEKQLTHRRSHSACGVLQQQPTSTHWHMEQNTITGSIQHKGQFYFITGVYKSGDSSVPSPPPCSTEPIDFHTTAEVQRSHNSVENKNLPLRKQSGSEILLQKTTVNTKEPSSSHHFAKPPDVTDLECKSVEMSRCHPRSHPIFFCGPEHSPLTTSALNKSDQNVQDPVNKDTRRLRADLPTEKINKETTPLLYHLTGASRASGMRSGNGNRNSAVGRKEADCSSAPLDGSSCSSENSGEATEEEKSNEFYYLCNTMDDSFKKYYKEKLKDAQSKVLRETSYKRKDLRLSWQKMIEHCCDKRPTVGPSAPSSQENTNPAHHLLFQSTDTLNNSSYEVTREPVRQENVAQPQVPRIGCRKRLTLEQKKLSNSEPEKLHQLEEGPRHVTCRSLGSEGEGLLPEDHYGPHSLLAVRRKIFEMRGRAMSACSFSKNSLRNFQQKALAAFTERKSVCKVAEPQQASPQLHAEGRQSDWAPKPHAEFREKPPRPQSASRIYDSGFRHSQFIITPDNQTQQSSWREQRSAYSKKSASVEDLLEERQIPRSHRSFSTSSPFSFHQVSGDSSQTSHTPELSIFTRLYFTKTQEHFDSSKDSATHHTHHSRVEVGSPAFKEHVVPVPDQKQVWVVASKGKSVEELGTSVVSSTNILSKSSDQLDQIHTSNRKKTSIKSDHIGIGPESGSLEHAATSTAGTFGDRTSHVLMTGSKVTVASSSPKGTSENHEITSSLQPVPQEMFLIPAGRSHGDFKVSLGYRINHSLWLPSRETNEEKKCSVSGSEQKTSPYTSSRGPSPPASSSYLALAEAQGQKKGVWRKRPMNQSQWVMMVQEVVTADPSLARILYPVANRKTAVMLMEQMLSEDTLVMEDHYKNNQEQTFPAAELNMFRSSLSSGAAVEDDYDDDDDNDGVSGLSAPPDRTFPCDITVDITEMKRRLMAGIEEQLESLEGLRSSLQSEAEEVKRLGRSLEVLVQERCSTAELERYTQFIEDLERVISLLFCLSARLARVENALSTAHQNMDPEEKDSLLSRHRLLCKQREDAKDLKENLDRRERMVFTFLAKQLMEIQMQEYRRFIQSKASLLIRQKELEEKQRLGTEQLQALLNSIPP